jgi:hypothetical protein
MHVAVERRIDGWLVFSLHVHIAYSNTSNPLIDWFSGGEKVVPDLGIWRRMEGTGVVAIVEGGDR